jgi:hypothetical protein
MSSYYDDDRSRRQRSTRERRRDDYDDSTVYDQNVRDTRIVKRRDDSVDSIEEVPRDFAPGERGAVYRETTVRKSGHRPIRTRSSDDRFYDDRYDDRSYTSRRRDDDYVVVDRPNRRSRDYDSRKLTDFSSIELILTIYRSISSSLIRLLFVSKPKSHTTEKRKRASQVHYRRASGLSWLGWCRWCLDGQEQRQGSIQV